MRPPADERAATYLESVVAEIELRQLFRDVLDFLLTADFETCDVAELRELAWAFDAASVGFIRRAEALRGRWAA